MVKCLLRYRLLLTILLAASVLVCGAVWLLWTPTGVHWLLGEVSRWSPVRIEARQVIGRMADDLLLEGLHIRWSEGMAKIDTLHFCWRPILLFKGQIKVEELALVGVNVQLQAPGEDKEVGGPAAEFSWPQVTGLPRWLQGKVEFLRVEDLIWGRPDQGSLLMKELTACLAWRSGVLSASDLTAITPLARAEGWMEASFIKPALRLEIDAELAEPAAGMDGLSLTMRLEPARRPELLSGNMRIVANSGQVQRLQLATELGVAEKVIKARHFELIRPGLPGMVSGQGEVVLSGHEPFLSLQAKVADLDLSPEAGVPTDLSGTLDLRGSRRHYEGCFTLADKVPGWRAIRLSGRFAGDLQGVTLSRLDGIWLNGTLQGELKTTWMKGIALSGSLQGRNLNPGGIAPEWPGRVNLDASGVFSRTEKGLFEAAVKGELRESTLRDMTLTAKVDAGLRGEDLQITTLELRGEGFEVSAQGSLMERLNLEVNIEKFSSLVPRMRGRLQAQGWMRWHNRHLTGSITGQGTDLLINGLRVAELKLAAIPKEEGQPFNIKVGAQKVLYGQRQIDTAALDISGMPAKHNARLTLQWLTGEACATASGAYLNKKWIGTLIHLSGRDTDTGEWNSKAPAKLEVSVNGFKLSPLRIVGVQGENLQLSADISRNPMRGFLQGEWHELNLTRANSWLRNMDISGRSFGSVRIRWLANDRLELGGRVGAVGKLIRRDMELDLREAVAELDWDESGLKALCDVKLSSGGGLRGRFSSDQPARLKIPERGEINLSWDALDLVYLRPWLPCPLTVEGQLSGQIKGEWLPELQLVLGGRTCVAGGNLEWQDEEGRITAALRTLDLNWVWRNEALSGEFSVMLVDYGQAQGSFRFPLPARLPTAMLSEGPVHGALTTKVQEKGMLAAIFPGLLQESRGELNLKLRVGGTWQTPHFSGSLLLAKAGAYLPAAGIDLKEVGIQARLSKDRIWIDSFEASSGPGRIQGSATMRLSNWSVANYQATLKGKRFQTINLPELQVLSDLKLNVEGTKKELSVRGEVVLSELIVLGRQSPAPLRQSPDVIVVDAVEAPKRELPVILDAQVRVMLGERVLVKVGGIDAHLAGGVNLSVKDLDDIAAQGEIHVVRGFYSGHGLHLPITRGSLLFAGGPADQPTLDILALRKVGEVRAGVQVAGTPRAPLVKLYSEPSMPDTDILAYIVLGRPLGEDRGQADMLMLAAAALLSKGESVVLQDRLKRRLGVDVLEVEAGDGDVSTSMVTVGKYLSPKLYISFGYSLFTDTNEIGLRYGITENWEIESKMGIESGVDLYYKIEFE
jgi:translocation and assembly module TamB